MISKIRLYLNTIKFLKPIQIYYRIYYHFDKERISDSTYQDKIAVNYIELKFSHVSPSYLGNGKFKFLNIEHEFINNINWELSDHGKLWQYNLSYFDFLNSEISKVEGERLITDFIEKKENLRSAIEPYPTSLRIINWIRFLSKHHIEDPRILNFLKSQSIYLLNKIEYHLLGNHLLENAFALYTAGRFFKDCQFLEKGTSIIITELKAQILNDGGHFEQSPMYHQIILFRVLECIDVHNREDTLGIMLKAYASKMLSWLNQLTFNNGMIPLFNDSVCGFAPLTNELNAFASRLNIENKVVRLSDSGFRKYSKTKFECIVKSGEIKAKYQPGHAHADALSFVLNYMNIPYFVDTGVSTYNIGDRRTIERSTRSHNTVTVDDADQSEIWGGFRVGNRANVEILEELENFIRLRHDGYLAYHSRSFKFNESNIVIIDNYDNEKTSCSAHFHIHPDREIIIKNNEIIIDSIRILFLGNYQIFLEDYKYAEEFNYLRLAKKVVVMFYSKLTTSISFLE